MQGKWGYAVAALVIVLILGLFKATKTLAIWLGGLILLSVVVTQYDKWKYLLPQGR